MQHQPLNQHFFFLLLDRRHADDAADDAVVVLERDPTLPVDRESDFVRRGQHEGGRSPRATTPSEKGTTIRERERETSLF